MLPELITVNNFSSVVHYYSEKACRWVTAQQEPCNAAGDSSSTILKTESIALTTSTSATPPPTTTKTIATKPIETTTSSNPTPPTASTSEPDETAVLIESNGDDIAGAQQNSTENSDAFSCETLESDWICSNGAQNHSLCLKDCSNTDTEQKICMCKESSCSWYHNGEKCSISNVGDSVSTTKTPSSVEMESTNDLSPTENSPSENISSPESKNDLKSLIHELHVTNTGNINVNFNMK